MHYKILVNVNWVDLTVYTKVKILLYDIDYGCLHLKIRLFKDLTNCLLGTEMPNIVKRGSPSLETHPSTASMNLARITDSIWDSAKVRRWFRQRFHAPKLPNRLECFLSRKAAVCNNLAVRYCREDHNNRPQLRVLFRRA